MDGCLILRRAEKRAGFGFRRVHRLALQKELGNACAPVWCCASPYSSISCMRSGWGRERIQSDGDGQQRAERIRRVGSGRRNECEKGTTVASGRWLL